MRCPTFAGSLSNSATTRKPWSAKMSEPGDRLAEVPGAEQGDVVLAGGAQDLADLRDQRVDVVAHSALAELAEARQVAADLGGVDVRVVGQLLGRDRLPAHLLGLREHLQVARQPRRHPERQPLGRRLAAASRWPARPQGLAKAHARPLYRAARSRAASVDEVAPTAPRRPARAPGCARRSGGAARGRATRRPAPARSSRSARTRSSSARASSQRWQPGLP